VKNFLLAIIFLGLASYFGYELYQRAKSADFWNAVDSNEELTHPDEIEIQRNDGEAIKVRLIARNASLIQFERLSDGQVFTFEIDQLDPASQERVLKHPNTGLSDSDELLRRGQLTLEGAYIEQLREAISQIDSKLSEMQLKYNASYSKTERRTLKRAAEDLEVERQELEAKVAERGGS
jgi:hypothetical protein